MSEITITFAGSYLTTGQTFIAVWDFNVTPCQGAGQCNRVSGGPVFGTPSPLIDLTFTSGGHSAVFGSGL
jgi:hypothetical protein